IICGCTKSTIVVWVASAVYIARCTKMASAGTTPFYGRKHELQRLEELAGKKTASLVIIKGRRRIGKSRLATELARRLPGYGALSFQGLPPTAHLTAGQE